MKIIFPQKKVTFILWFLRDFKIELAWKIFFNSMKERRKKKLDIQGKFFFLIQANAHDNNTNLKYSRESSCCFGERNGNSLTVKRNIFACCWCLLVRLARGMWERDVGWKFFNQKEERKTFRRFWIYFFLLFCVSHFNW